MSLTKVKAGNILLTTPGASSNDVTPATTQYVTTAIGNLIDTAPSTLNTLNELAAALGDDVNFSTTVTNSIATKLPLAGGTLTGTLTVAGSSSGTVDALIITNTDTTNNGLSIGVDSSENAFFWNGSNTSMNFATNNTLKMVIDARGNVGIGVTPSTGWVSSTDFTALQIGSGLALWGRGSGDHERLGLTANLYHDGSAFKHLNTGRVTSYEQNDGKHIFKYYASQAAGTSVTPTTAMTIDTSGNVGIGVAPKTDWHTGYKAIQIGESSAFFANTAADEVFMVQNARYTSGGWKYNSSGTATLFDMQSGNTRWRRAVSGSDDGTISWSDSMFIDTSGNVGIGTTAPTGRLHVSGGRAGVISTASSWGQFRVGNTGDGEVGMAFVNGATESDFLNDGDPACAYKVILGINPYSSGTRNFGIGNDTIANYHTIWTEAGHQLPRITNTYDLGSASKGFRNIYTNDLNLSNMPADGLDTDGNAYTRPGNDVDGTNGSWTIQEGANDLFIINRLNGKKYKFNLTEVVE